MQPETMSVRSGNVDIILRRPFFLDAMLTLAGHGTLFGSILLSSSATPIRRGLLTTSCHSCTGPCRPSITRSTRTTSLRAMVAQSEQAFLAMAQGNAPKGATAKILEYKDMEPFFIKGERDEP
jgi:hypothetical protein